MTPTHLILGASGGIGSTLARRLVEREAAVALAGRDEGRLRALEIPGASTHVVDATSVDDVQRVVDAVVAEHGRLDGSVNCVGSILLEPAHRTSADEWRATLSADGGLATLRAT